MSAFSVVSCLLLVLLFARLFECLLTYHCLFSHNQTPPQFNTSLIRSLIIYTTGNPTKKSEILSKVHQGFYQIVVATSVNEEVLQLPASRLVIQLDPPNPVSALVQIRSYFRESHTTFAMICRDNAFPKKVKDLLSRENNMIQAVQVINNNEFMY